MRFDVEFDCEDDGRWIAEILNLPGATAYGDTKEIALAAVEAIALRVIAERLEAQQESLESAIEFACA